MELEIREKWGILDNIYKVLKNVYRNIIPITSKIKNCVKTQFEICTN